MHFARNHKEQQQQCVHTLLLCYPQFNIVAETTSHTTRRGFTKLRPFWILFLLLSLMEGSHSYFAEVLMIY